MINFGVIMAFIHGDVRFVIADNKNFPGCAMIDGAYLGGDGQTMLQWLVAQHILLS
jgi:hypothetical protein